MSLTSYIFHFREDGSVQRLPLARWNRIYCNEEQHFSGCEGEITRIAFAYIELDERYTFKHLVSPLDTLMAEREGDSPQVIRAETRFRMLHYKHRCTWTPTSEDISRIIEMIWNH